MDMLYDLPSDVNGIIELGQWIATTTPIFWPLILGGMWFVVFTSSLRSMGQIRALLSSTGFTFFIAVLFYAAQWIDESWMIGSTIALGFSVMYAWSNKEK